MWTFFLVALRNLIQARRRTLLLGSAIAFVSLLLLLLLSISKGVSDRLIEASTLTSTGHVNVAGFYKQRANSATPLITDREKIRSLVQENISGLALVTDRARGWGRLIGSGGSFNTGLNGLILEESAFLKEVKLAEQSEYKKDGANKVLGKIENFGARNTILIFAGQAKKLGVDVGDTLTFITEANGGQANSVDLTVAAIARDMGFLSNFSVFVPRQTVLDLDRRGSDTTGAVWVYLKDIRRANEVRLQLENVFRKAGYTLLEHDPRPFFIKFQKIVGQDWRGLRLDLTTWDDEVSFINWIVTSLNGLSVFLVIILGLIIATGIANSMWMTVRERTKEIGTLRAIGMQKAQVRTLFMIEAALLGLFGALAGCVLGLVLISALNTAQIPINNSGLRVFLMTDVVKLSLQPVHLVGALLFLPALTALAAFYPSLKASQMPPVQALNQGK
ncbi:MAG: ABC transporter permease [Betaproteobacteria bacterium]|nr:ABC transporter permease [Betaproteobacteria bacterium]